MKEILLAFAFLFSLAAWIGLGYGWGRLSVVCPSPCSSYEAGYFDGQRNYEQHLQCPMPDVPFTAVFDTTNIDHYSIE